MAKTSREILQAAGVSRDTNSQAGSRNTSAVPAPERSSAANSILQAAGVRSKESESREYAKYQDYYRQHYATPAEKLAPIHALTMATLPGTRADGKTLNTLGAQRLLRDTLAAGGSSEDWYKKLLEQSEEAAATRDSAYNTYRQAQSKQNAGQWDEQGNYLGAAPAENIEELKELWQQADKAALWAESLAKMGKDNRYMDLSGNEDFRQNAAAGLERFEREAAELNARQEADRQAEYERYMELGTGGMAYEQSQVKQLQNDTAWREPREDWTQQERETFGYLYNRDPEEAYSYAENLNNNKNAAKAYTEQQAAEGWATKNFGTGAAATGLSILGQATAGADFLDNLMEYAARGTITQDAQLSPADYGNIMSGAIAETLNADDSWGNRVLEKLSPIFGDIGVGELYQVGYSALQSMTYAYLGGPVGGAAAYFGLGAKNGYEDAVLRGATPGQALTMGIASGLIESATEQLPIQNLLKMKSPSSVAGFFKSILQQSMIEGSEEAISQLGTTLADALVMGDKRDIQVTAERYMMQGMTREEAMKAAYKDWAKETAWSFMSGALSGGISGSVSSGTMALSKYRGDSGALIAEGLAAPEDSKAYEIAKRFADAAPEGRRTTGQLLAAGARATGRAAVNAGKAINSRVEAGFGPSAAYEKAQGLSRQSRGQSTTATQNAAEAAQEGQKGETDSHVANAPRNDSEGQVATTPAESRNDSSKGKYWLRGHEAMALTEALNEQNRSQVKEMAKAQLEGVQAEGDIEALSDTMAKALLGEQIGVIENANFKRNKQAVAVLDEMARARDKAEFKGTAGGAVRSAFDDAALIEAMREAEKGLPEYMRFFSKGETDSHVANAPRNDSEGQIATAPAEPRNDSKGQALNTREPEDDTETVLDADMIEATMQSLGIERNVARSLVLSRKDVDPEVYALGIEEAFKAGAQGLPRSQVGKDPESYAAKLSVEQRGLAHKAGELFGGRATAKAQAEVRQAVKQSTGRKGPGKVRYRMDKKSLSERQKKSIKVLERVADALGVDFYIEPKGLSSNGWYDPRDSSIHISADAGPDFEGSLLFTAAHELTHFIQDWSPAKYKVLANFLFEQYEISGPDLAQRMTEQIDKARKDKRELTPEEAYDEVVADSMEKMLLDGRVLSKLEAIKQQDASLFSKMMEYFRKLFKRINRLYKGLRTNSEEARIVERMGADTVRQIQDYFIEGLADAGESYRAAGGTKNTTDDGGVNDSNSGIKYSGKRVLEMDIAWDEDNHSSLKSQLIAHQEELNSMEAVTNVKYTKSGASYGVQLAEILRTKFGNKISRADGANFLFDDKAIASLRGYVTSDEEAAAILASPYVLKRGKAISGHKSHKNKGHPSVTYAAPVTINGTRTNVAVAVLFSDKDRPHSLRVLLPNGKEFVIKKEASSGMADVSPKKGGTRSPTEPANENISQSRPDVKHQSRATQDSAGNSLTQEQQEYFADSKARDKDGRLQIMYRGGKGDFTVFDRKKSKPSNLYGRGFYFTNSKSHAEQYGSAKAFYLNIEHPLGTDSHEITKGQLLNFLKAIEDDGEDYDLYNYGEGSTAESVLNLVWDGRPDFDLLNDINATAIGDLVAATELFNEVNHTDYDGFILPTETVIFNSEQAKLTSNKTPTINPDIRYQSRDVAAVERANRSLERQNAKLKEDIKGLKKLLRLQKSVTKGRLFDPSSVDTAAKTLMKSVSAKGDRAELREELNRLYDYIATDKEVTWEGVKAQASGAAEWLMQHMEREERLDPYAEEVLRELKGLRVSLNENQIRNGAYAYGGAREFRNAALGKFIISKNATPLDSIWAELAESYPSLFDRDISDADQGTELIRIFERLRSMTAESELDYYDSELLEQELIRQVYDSYWDISTMQTVADTKQEEINQLKAEHRRQMDELKAEHEQKIRQLKESHKAETAKIRREAEQRYTQKRLELLRQVEDARQRNAANREISNLRRMISREAKQLDGLLNRGGKDRNVKEDMQSFVARALYYHSAIFADNITAEEMIKTGFTVQVMPNEENLIATAREILQELDGVTPGSERERKLRGRLNYRIEKLQPLITRQREAMYKANVDTILEELLKSYKELLNSDKQYIKDAYDADLAAYLEGMAEKMSGRTAVDMSVDELREVYDAFKAIHKAVLNTNKAFADGHDLRSDGAEAVQQVKAAGGSKKQRTSLQAAARRFGFGNMKPVYFFKLLGSKTLVKYFNNVLKAEGVWAQDVEEAKAHARKLMEKYKYNSWDMEKLYKFKSTNGDEFELTVPQMLTLYALTRRGGSVFDHLRTGGFVFDPNSTRTAEGRLGIKKELNLDDATAYQLGTDELGLIARALSEEQRDFVKEMQEYLSTVMGGKGNEVSEKMYGIKLFKEDKYFPLRVASQYMERIREAGSNERKIKNSGFTKPLKPNANNPVVLGDFTDIWSQHVNDMSMYHAFVLPMEDFYRVYNYKTRAEDNAAMESVNAAIQNAYGKPAAEYVDQLLKDINGGAIRDPRASLTTALVGKFKKASTFASASVVIQQPSSVGRAFALIDPKYFTGRRMDNLAHYARWEEIKKYAPVAIIKEMGHFDTNMGRSTSDYIQQKEYKGLKERIKGIVTDEQYRDDVLSRLPALADEITWCYIWEAVKRETAAKQPGLKNGSEEFLKAAGDRFTEVIQETQVYDSVLSRSAYMRSKDSGMTMLTSFMAEPTTTMNMVLNAIVQGRRGDKAAARKGIGAALTSVVMNAALVSIVYAMRDDDEYETFLEKYLASFAVEIADGVNPFTYFPVIRDIWSAAQGYDIERADMSLITDLMDSINNTTKLLYQDTSNMSEKEQEAWLKKLKDALWKDADYITALVGLPVKNIRRDIMAVGNTIGTLAADYKTSPEGLKNVVGESLVSAVPFLGQRPKDSKGDRLYNAIMAGDREYADRLLSSYATESAAATALRKALRDNEDRIVLAAAARLDGNTDEYVRIYEELLAEGNFDRDDIIKAIESEMNAMSDSGSSSTPASPELIKAKDYYRAIAAGDSEAIETVVEMYTQQEEAKGKLPEDALSSLESGVTSTVRTDYMEDGLTRDEAKELLIKYGGKAEDDAEAYLKRLDFEKEYGFSWDEREEAYRRGEISQEELQQGYMDMKGMSEEEAHYEAEYIAVTSSSPELRVLTVGQYRGYYTPPDGWYTSPADMGIDLRTYAQYRLAISTMRGVDADGDGDTDRNSKKNQILEYINSLPLTPEQKDLLYYQNGWSSKNLKKAPWH